MNDHNAAVSEKTRWQRFKQWLVVLDEAMEYDPLLVMEQRITRLEGEIVEGEGKSQECGCCDSRCD